MTQRPFARGAAKVAGKGWFVLKWVRALFLILALLTTTPLTGIGDEVSQDNPSIQPELTAVAVKTESTAAAKTEEQEASGQVLTADLKPIEKEKDHKEAIYVTGEVDGKKVLMLNREFLEEQAALLRGIGFGFEVGYWGTGTVIGLVSIVPLTKSGKAAMRFRIFMPFGPHLGHDWDPVINIEVGYVRRSPIFFGVFRLSAGGGIYAGFRPRTFPLPKGGIQAVSPGTHVDTKATCENSFVDPKGCRWGFSGGGFAGVEFMLGKSHTIAIQVGGQGYVHAHKLDSAFQITLGEIWYFGKKD
ncbi:MAG: hypothetical protein GY762_07225 [Proteobacteria bacterium]|nr:hypothetical protein [Pseudomonadota bacterium]